MAPRYDNPKQQDVLMVTNALYDVSGAALQMVNLAGALRAKGLRVDTASLYGRSAGTKLTAWFPRLHALHLRDLKSLIHLLFIYRRTKPRVIHFHFFNLLVPLAAILLAKQGVQVVSKITLLDADDPAYYFSTGRLKWVYSRLITRVTNLTLVCTTRRMFERTRRFLEQQKCTPVRVAHIPNGVDVRKFSDIGTRTDARDFLKISPSAHVLVLVGAVTHRKGAHTALRALEETVDKHPDTLLLLVGVNQWSERSTHKAKRRNHFVAGLRRYAADQGLSANVHFVGNVADVRPYLRAADIFLLPSRREGMPNALLEAMAVGLPTITSDLSGAADDVVVEGQSGFVTSFDAREISQRICYLIDNPAIRNKMRERSTAKILSDFNLNQIASRYLDLYRALPGHTRATGQAPEAAAEQAFTVRHDGRLASRRVA